MPCDPTHMFVCLGGKVIVQSLSEWKEAWRHVVWRLFLWWGMVKPEDI